MIDFATSTPINVHHQYHHMEHVRELERMMKKDIIILGRVLTGLWEERQLVRKPKMLFQIVLMIFMLRKVIPLVQDEEDEQEMLWWSGEAEKPSDDDPLVGLYPDFCKIMQLNDRWKQQSNCGGVEYDRTPIKAIELMVRAVNQSCSRAWDEEIKPFQYNHSIADVLQRIESLLRNGVFLSIYHYYIA